MPRKVYSTAELREVATPTNADLQRDYRRVYWRTFADGDELITRSALSFPMKEILSNGLRKLFEEYDPFPDSGQT